MKRDRARVTAKRTLDAAPPQSYLRGCWVFFPAAPATGEGGKSRGAGPLWASPQGCAAGSTALIPNR